MSKKTYVCLDVHTHTPHMLTKMLTHTCTHTHADAHMLTMILTHTCNTHMHTRTHIHTHTHTHAHIHRLADHYIEQKMCL